MSHVLRQQSDHPLDSEETEASAEPDRSPDRSMRIARALLLVCVAVVAALAIGFVAFAVRIATAEPPADPHAEGIVVLTGGSARIDGALHLLAEHRAGRLLISGVNPAVGPEALADTVGPELDRLMACCVDLGHAARDTIGNATETRDWADGHRYRSLIVVTSDYHMPRSLAELADVMPGVELIAYPVSNPDLHLADWWRNGDAFMLIAREYAKYLLTVARQALSPMAPPVSNLSGSG